MDIIGWLKNHKKEIFIVLLILILGFSIRSYLMKYDYMFEFDTYWHTRMLDYVITDGTLPDIDPLAYYWDDMSTRPNTAPLFWQISALFYGIFALFMGAGFETLIFTVKFLPAFYGAVIAALMYFLMKEITESKAAGIVAGVVAAVIPAFVYRTMAGFFEEDSIGFFFLIFGMWMLIRGIKNNKLDKHGLFYTILAGISFAAMAWSWAAYLMIIPIGGGYFVLNTIYMYLKNYSNEELMHFIKVCGIALAIFVVVALPIRTDMVHQTAQLVKEVLPVGLIGTAYAAELDVNAVPIAFDLNETAVEITTTDSNEMAGTSVNETNNQKKYGPTYFEDREGEKLPYFGSLVGEESKGSVYFLNKYTIFVFIPFLVFLLLGYLLLFRNNKYLLLVFVWGLITAIMAWMKLKFTYYFGLPIAAAAGVMAWFIFKDFVKRTIVERNLIVIFSAFILITGIAAGAFFVVQNVPHIEMDTGWKESLFWIKDNTEKDAKLFNWWDEGHWLTFISQRKVITDNMNARQWANVDFGRFGTETSESDAYDLVKLYDSDYVIISEDLIEKQYALALYGQKTIDFRHPNVSKYYGSRSVKCKEEKEFLTENVYYICGNTRIPEAEFLSYPDTWQKKPIVIQQDQQPLYVYRNKENTRLYVFTAATNMSMLGRMFTKDPSLEKFEEVKRIKDVSIWRVK